ncbi:MAG: helix-turn-helix domain-containing protein [Eubacterium sp.]|uniref:helix-turn-helix domain-containing protein n=1 Tax=Eubacterium sp. TaxID=142586 RepID=UPI0025C15AD4|nr:helix-turn-helix transcriptional regulator [Eubacterium sp.]
MVDFGSNLKELRLKHKMTQKELADKIGVTKSVISYYELQERSPSPEILIKLSRIFHVTTDYLLGIEHKHTIDVSNLSSEQLTVIEQLIKLFENDDK